ncbi:MAG: hypothetical protein HYR63_14120 [Proteobacteria bacterium]|nr:hypothetical protein [Pseudomonadota bacterium]
MSREPATPELGRASANASARLRDTEAAISLADSSDKIEAFALSASGAARTELTRLARRMRRQARRLLERAIKAIE